QRRIASLEPSTHTMGTVQSGSYHSLVSGIEEDFRGKVQNLAQPPLPVWLQLSISQVLQASRVVSKLLLIHIPQRSVVPIKPSLTASKARSSGSPKLKSVLYR